MSQGSKHVDLDTALGYLLKQTDTVLRAAMDRVLRPLEMTVAQYACLELLAQRPGLSNSELARGAFVSRQSMNVLLQSLHRAGLVSRPDQAPSGRALPTRLTPLGARRRAAASEAVEGVEDRMRGGLDAAEQAQLRHLLAACITALTAP